MQEEPHADRLPAPALKRCTEAPEPRDGMRVLVDRRWPPALKKDAVTIDLWLKDAGPSEALRRWWGRDVRRWEGFTARYRDELRRRDDLVRLLTELRRRGPVTLLYGVCDAAHNNAAALKRILDELP